MKNIIERGKINYQRIIKIFVETAEHHLDKAEKSGGINIQAVSSHGERTGQN